MVGTMDKERTKEEEKNRKQNAKDEDASIWKQDAIECLTKQ